MTGPLRGVTTRGRCLVAAGVAAAVCALVLDERDLLRVAVLLVALPVLSALLLGLPRLRLQVSRDVRPRSLSVGVPAEVHLRLHAAGRLPVAGLLLTDAVPAVLGEEPRYAVGALVPGTSASVVYGLTPRVRGRHVLGPVEVRLADPLGLVEVVRRLPGTTTVLARPQLLPLAGLPGSLLDAVETGGSPSGSGAAQQHVQDALVRPYRTGDDLRSVHWRSTARRDELMVRPHEQSRRTGTVVLLDVRADAHRGLGPHSTLERAICLAASAAAHLARHDRTVRLVTSDGRDLGSGESALDQLALLTPAEGGSLAGAAEVAGHDELLAVLGTVDVAAAHLLVDATATAGPGRAVVLGADGPGATLLRDAGWAVVPVTERRPLPLVWEQLCAARGAGAAQAGGRW